MNELQYKFSGVARNSDKTFDRGIDPNVRVISCVSWIVCRLFVNEPIHEVTRKSTNRKLLCPSLILKEEVYQIVGAAMDVYYQLGRGFHEPGI